MYEQFARFADTLTTAGMEGIIGAGVGASLGYMRSALMLYVVIAAVMVMYAKMDGWDAVKRGVRAMAIIALLQAGTYNTYVRDVFWTTIPTTIASSFGGAPTQTTGAQRFDLVDRASSNLIARADAQANGILNWRPQISIALAQLCMKLFLLVCFALWLVARIATALLICAGPFLLIAFLFDATRIWVMQWIGKLVGLAVWQLCAAILTEMVLRGSMEFIQTTAGANSTSLSEMIDNLWKIVVWFGINMLVMFALPALAAIGSSSATTIGVATTIGGAAVAGAASLGASAAMGAARLGGAAGRAAGRAAARSIRSSSNRRT